MTLSQAQLDGIATLIDGDGVTSLNGYVGVILQAREDVLALTRIHEDVPEANALTVLANAKLRAKAAADALSVLLS